MAKKTTAGTKPRTGLTCLRFALKLYQGVGLSDAFGLEVFDTLGNRYLLNPASIMPASPRAALVGALLSRIGAVNGQPGWKFNATFNANLNYWEISG